MLLIELGYYVIETNISNIFLNTVRFTKIIKLCTYNVRNTCVAEHALLMTVWGAGHLEVNDRPRSQVSMLQEVAVGRRTVKGHIADIW